MRKLMLVLMCATTMTSMAACGAKEPVTPEVTKAVTETKTAEEQETVSETVGDKIQAACGQLKRRYLKN